ncbi:MAG: periplasmic heavy metal sensor [Candidatus Aminicenantales bacterium]
MVKKYKLWVALTLIVVFGLGAAAGVFGERYLMHKRPRGPVHERTPFPLLEPVAKALALTAEQQDKLREIFKRSDERMKELDGEIHVRLREVRAQLKSEVDGVLTPEQRAKLEDMIQKERAKRQPEHSGSEAPRNERDTPRETK